MSHIKSSVFIKLDEELFPKHPSAHPVEVVGA